MRRVRNLSVLALFAGGFVLQPSLKPGLLAFLAWFAVEVIAPLDERDDILGEAPSVATWKVELRSAALAMVGILGIRVLLGSLLILLVLPSWHDEIVSQRHHARSLPLWMAVILYPVLEEIFFRKALLVRLRSWINERSAVLISSLLFGLIHGMARPDAVIFGAVQSYTYLRTRSLWVPIAVHVIHNGSVSLLDSMIQEHQSPPTPDREDLWIIAAASLAVSLVISALGFYLYWKYLSPEERT